MDVLHHFPAEVDGLECSVIEASQAISDAKNLVIWYTIVFQGEHNVLYDIIEPGAKTSTCYHCSSDLQQSSPSVPCCASRPGYKQDMTL